MPRTLDEKNKAADRVNPTKSGIRSGNPELEPEARRKAEGKTTKDRPQTPPAHDKG
jgi:hypothetical protein